MAQFKLTCVDEDNCTTSVEFEGIFLPHVIEKVEGFLKASGFFFEELSYTKSEEIDFEEEIALKYLDSKKKSIKIIMV